MRNTRLWLVKGGVAACALALVACGGSTAIGEPDAAADVVAEAIGDPGTVGDQGLQPDDRDVAGGDEAGDEAATADLGTVDVPPEATDPDAPPGDVAAQDPGADAPATDEGEEAGLPGDPGQADDGGAEPDGLVEDGAVDPGADDPGAVDPGTVDPGAVDPGAVDPGAVDPGAVDPGADAGPVTVTVSPVAPEDVVASYLMDPAAGEWNLFGGADLPLGRHWEEGHVGYHAAIRFPAVPVPTGATIESAILAWYPTNEIDAKERLWLKITAERTADSPPLSLSEYDAGRPDQRLRTGAAIAEWAIRCNSDCTDNDFTEYDCPQRHRDCWDRTVQYACPKDLKALVAEVVALPDWTAGNALTIFLDPNVPQDYIDRDTASRSITGVDPARGAGFRPTLTIRYR